MPHCFRLTGSRELLRRVRVSDTLLLALVLLLPPGLARAQLWDTIPGGRMQIHPAVAEAAHGPFLVVWEEYRATEESDIMGLRAGFWPLLDTPAKEISWAERNQAEPAVACLDSNFFVVWTDFRNGQPAIYGARVRNDAVPLDSEGICIRSGPPSVGRAQIVAMAEGCLVVWEEAPADSEQYIAGARISTSGALLDSEPIHISRAPGWQGRPRINLYEPETTCAVIWEQHSPDGSPAQAIAARISSDGRLLDSAGIRVCRDTWAQTRPCIAAAWNPGFPPYLAVWVDGRDSLGAICAAWLSDSLAPLDSSGVIVYQSGNPKHDPCVQFNWLSDNFPAFLILWEEERPAGSGVWQIEAYAGDQSLHFWWDCDIALGDLNLSEPAFSAPLNWAEPDYSMLVMTGVSRGVPSIPATVVDLLAFVSIGEQPVSARPRQVRVTPSIAWDRCRVEWQATRDGQVEIRIRDAAGRLSRRFELSPAEARQGSVSFSVADMSAGVYFIEVSTPNRTASAKLVVRH